MVHAAPPILTVTVRGDDGQMRAEGKDLQATDDTPMTRSLAAASLTTEPERLLEGDPASGSSCAATDTYAAASNRTN